MTGTAAPTSVSAVTAMPTSLATTASTLDLTTGTASEGGVDITFTVPDGWKNSSWSVYKPNSGPLFGVIFFAVANIFTDPCQWVEVQPPVGPTVDDLVAAYADVPDLHATSSTDIAVDGFQGQQLEFTVPDYDESECKRGRYGLFQDSQHAGQGPNYWAQGPNQYHRLWILDVDGTRLVIASTYFPDTSERDRADLEVILDSIRLG